MRDVRFQEEQEARIAEWLQKVKFRKQIFGGVSEADVFKKIGELNELYREALIAERARYETLLAEKPEVSVKGSDVKSTKDTEEGGGA